LADPIYIGWRHDRIRDRDYDDFVETFVAAVEARWPLVLLQWEDFARANAGRLLARYRDRLFSAIGTGFARSTTTSRARPLSRQAHCSPPCMSPACRCASSG
jgi:hypothetical protein